jgi:hypothetical protein
MQLVTFLLDDRRYADHFIIARTSRRLVAFPVDSTDGVIEVSDQEVTDAPRVLPGLETGILEFVMKPMVRKELGGCWAGERNKGLIFLSTLSSFSFVSWAH